VFAPPIQRLIAELAKLPGVGQRTAQRLALHILRGSDEDAQQLAAALIRLRHLDVADAEDEQALGLLSLLEDGLAGFVAAHLALGAEALERRGREEVEEAAPAAIAGAAVLAFVQRKMQTFLRFAKFAHCRLR